MEDRFRLRVYDPQLKKMYDVKNIYYEGSPMVTVSYRPLLKMQLLGVFLMQCTGLKDKNGKLIYEGDVCKTKDKIGKIKWNTAEHCYMFHYGKFVGDWVLFAFTSDEVEIIGNIYENKDLLNA